MKQWIGDYFEFAQNQTNFKTEFIAGITTFMTMSYIIFVNPAILCKAMGNENFAGVMAATCISSTIATFIMGLWARYPIALAPGMGINAFFTYTICLQMQIPWQTALGMVFLSGVLFFILSLVKIRQMIVDAVPATIKIATAVGIGIFIAFIGLKEAGIVVDHPATLVKLGKLGSPPTLLAIAGVILTAGLMSRHVKGAILWGILGTGALALIFGMAKLNGIFGLPSIKSVFAQLDIKDAFRWEYLSPILVLLFFDMFDTIGTLVGVGEKGGFLKNGKLERGSRALLADATGTLVGAVCGTSTVTSYIESSAGVSEGGKTGLTSVFVGLFFIAALFFTPVAAMLGGGYQIAPDVYLHPITAPALIVVGFLMMSCAAKIPWDDITEGLPAFLIIILMPLTFSIAHGLALGFISYVILKIVSGRAKEISWFVYLLAGIFLLGYWKLPLP